MMGGYGDGMSSLGWLGMGVFWLILLGLILWLVVRLLPGSAAGLPPIRVSHPWRSSTAGWPATRSTSSPGRLSGLLSWPPGATGSDRHKTSPARRGAGHSRDRPGRYRGGGRRHPRRLCCRADDDARWDTSRRLRISIRFVTCGSESSRDCRERRRDKHGWSHDGRPGQRHDGRQWHGFERRPPWFPMGPSHLWWPTMAALIMRWSSSPSRALRPPVRARLPAMPRLMRRAASAKHPEPAVPAPARESCRAPQAG